MTHFIIVRLQGSNVSPENPLDLMNLQLLDEMKMQSIVHSEMISQAIGFDNLIYRFCAKSEAEWMRRKDGMEIIVVLLITRLSSMKLSEINCATLIE